MNGVIPNKLYHYNAIYWRNSLVSVVLPIQTDHTDIDHIIGDLGILPVEESEQEADDEEEEEEEDEDEEHDPDDEAPKPSAASLFAVPPKSKTPPPTSTPAEDSVTGMFVSSR